MITSSMIYIAELLDFVDLKLSVSVDVQNSNKITMQVTLFYIFLKSTNLELVNKNRAKIIKMTWFGFGVIYKKR